jgi:hypothetical protein
MTITSYGYPQGIQDGSDLSQWSLLAGHRYSVAGYSDLRVTASLTGTRRVNIASGWGGGRGVAVHSSATESLNLPEPSGSSQWFLVGLKRWVTNPDYDSEAALGTPEASPYISQFVYAAGTSSKVVPSVPQNPGTDDTQWLALCRVTSGSSTVVEVIDLRLISGETGAGFVVMSEMALGALEDLPGARVYRADTTSGHVPSFYTRVLSGGTLEWRNESDPDAVLDGAASTQAPPGGWARVLEGCRMVRKGGQRTLVYAVSRAGGSAGGRFTSNGRGGLGDMHVGSVREEDRPGTGRVIPLIGRFRQSSGGATYGAFGHVTSIGNIYLHSMLPNVECTPGDELVLTGTWYK